MINLICKELDVGLYVRANTNRRGSSFMTSCVLGFSVERLDPISGSLHLGNGYRAYNPVLMRFDCPDSWSPFAEGGINPYAYCADDPVNRTDPSGHMGWQAITSIVVGVIGLALVPFTLGQSLSITACIMAGAEVVSGGTSIASGVLHDSYPRLSSILGWTSSATGMLSLGAGLVSSGYWLLNEAKNVNDAMVMSLDTEFNYLASFGRTWRRGGRPDTIMSVIFEDRVESATHETFRRLNIWAHGRPPGHIFINGRSLTADMLTEHFDAAGIELEEYDVVRFISCNSVNLARSFTENSSLTATGFRGNVIVQGHTVAALRQMSAEVEHLPQDIAHIRFEQAVEQYPGRTTASGINIFEDREFFRVTRGTPVSFRLLSDHTIEQIEGNPLPAWYEIN